MRAQLFLEIRMWEVKRRKIEHKEPWNVPSRSMILHGFYKATCVDSKWQVSYPGNATIVFFFILGIKTIIIIFINDLIIIQVEVRTDRIFYVNPRQIGRSSDNR